MVFSNYLVAGDKEEKNNIQVPEYELIPFKRGKYICGSCSREKKEKYVGLASLFHMYKNVILYR